MDSAHCECHLAIVAVPFLPSSVQQSGELCYGKHRIGTKPTMQADMSVLAYNTSIRISEIAWNTGCDPDWTIGVDKSGGLFDMYFDKSVRIRFFHKRFASQKLI